MSALYVKNAIQGGIQMVNHKKPRTRKQKGQSTLEYIVLVTGVIAVLLIFLNPTSGPFSTAFNETLTFGTNGMTDMANRLGTSRPLAPAVPAQP